MVGKWNIALERRVFKTNFTVTPKCTLVSEDVYRVSIKINYWCYPSASIQNEILGKFASYKKINIAG